ncbi:hypothetical protein QKW60_09535 [Defluviimonas aestuarii]|uniref:winged helix domain-containing protein n=1 Tax=Albidovulum aestuarii TaxID=1130726 RepID=UPI002499CE23|nr:hypothetical protein [Defluviimonas aestuarii]MDI3336648.1 hypothetical protein [Defluviimonas aestuarii]
MQTDTKKWGNAKYAVIAPDGTENIIMVNGRERWALECLIAAGEIGCTPIDHPGPRWSAYTHDIRGMGVEIETVHEPHGGDWPGTHARYVLRSRVRRVEADREAA